MTRPSRSRILPRGARIGTLLMRLRSAASLYTSGFCTCSFQNPETRKTNTATVKYWKIAILPEEVFGSSRGTRSGETASSRRRSLSTIATLTCAHLHLFYRHDCRNIRSHKYADQFGPARVSPFAGTRVRDRLNLFYDWFLAQTGQSQPPRSRGLGTLPPGTGRRGPCGGSVWIWAIQFLKAMRWMPIPP